jgi:hypothetical protein
MKRVEEVGEIMVKIYRGGEAEVASKVTVPIVKLRGIGETVHEKALKGDAKSHSAV